MDPSTDNLSKLIVPALSILFGFLLGLIVPFFKWLIHRHQRARLVIIDADQAELILRDFHEDATVEPYENFILGFTVKNVGRSPAFAVRAQLNHVRKGGAVEGVGYTGAFELRPHGQVNTDPLGPIQAVTLPSKASVTFVLAQYDNGPADTIYPVIRETLPYFREAYEGEWTFFYDVAVFSDTDSARSCGATLKVARRRR